MMPAMLPDIAPVIAALEHCAIARCEALRTARNRVQRVELDDGRVLGVKHYARGRDYAREGAAMRELAGVVPVPEVVSTLDCVIAYRWLDGDALAPSEAWAAPLGSLLGTLARCGAREDLETPRLLARCTDEALARALANERFDEPAGFVHGALAAHRVLVAQDRIAGVLDWETFAIGSPLHDVRAALRLVGDTPTTRAAIERAHGGLGPRWWQRARLLDALEADRPEAIAHALDDAGYRAPRT